MNKQFKNMKIRIKDEEHSRAVQEVLFKLGFGWRGFSRRLEFTDAQALYATKADNSITYSLYVSEFFEVHSAKEVTLEDLQAILKQDTDTRFSRVYSTGVSAAYDPTIPVSDRFDALMLLMLESDCSIMLCDEHYFAYDKWDNETKYQSYEDLITGLAVIKKYKDLVDSV